VIVRGLVWSALAALCAAVSTFAGPVALEDPSTGKAVVVEPGAEALHLVFFATWCPACVGELPRLGEIEERWSRKGYRLVLVGVRTRQSGDRLAGFVKAQRPPGRLLFDLAGEAEREWKAAKLPTHLVLDASGKEVARSSALDAKIEAAIADLLAEKRGGGRGP